MRVLLVALLVLLAAASTAQAQVQVHVDIGFHLPAPPRLVVVPQVPVVKYVPVADTPANIFFYDGQYWAFQGNGWYVSRGYNGPWIVVAPQFVPRPLLIVPVQYYHVPPGHWKKWNRAHAPHWREEWGPEWADKRGWKGGDHDDDRGHPGKGHGKGHGRG
ncbi:MAG TPA: hypothetical protein VFE48_25615 [Methylomirabilota bacterium]|jgi:hypothetical protein|nr:hypothetical protein [Methylomirabilota bacterium]